MKWFIKPEGFNFSIRSLMLLILLGGATYLAVVDPKVRDKYFELCYLGVGGYLGQLIPKQKQVIETDGKKLSLPNDKI